VVEAGLSPMAGRIPLRRVWPSWHGDQAAALGTGRPTHGVDPASWIVQPQERVQFPAAVRVTCAMRGGVALTMAAGPRPGAPGWVTTPRHDRSTSSGP